MARQLKDHIDQLSKLTDQEFEFVLSHFERKSFKKRQVLFQAGEPVRYYYFILSGLLKLVYVCPEGKQHIVSFATEERWENDFHAFVTCTKATMSLECVEDTEVLCLSLPGYHTLCASMQKMEHFFLQKANIGFITAQQRIISGLSSNAKERFEQVQSQFPSLNQRVSKSLIASYLGVSRETLSRLDP